MVGQWALNPATDVRFIPRQQKNEWADGRDRTKAAGCNPVLRKRYAGSNPALPTVKK